MKRSAVGEPLDAVHDHTVVAEHRPILLVVPDVRFVRSALDVVEEQGGEVHPTLVGMRVDPTEAGVDLQDGPAPTIGVAPEQVGLAHAATAVTTAVTKPSREQGEIIRENSETAAKKIVDFLAAENLI